MLPSTQHPMPIITTSADAHIKVGASPQAASRKPASMRKKIVKGRKLSGARTGSHKAARPHPFPTPYSGAKSSQIKR